MSVAFPGWSDFPDPHSSSSWPSSSDKTGGQKDPSKKTGSDSSGPPDVEHFSEEMPEFDLSDSTGSSFDEGGSKAPSNAPVKGVRTEADLNMPKTEDSEHKDFEMSLGDKTVKMRWDKDLGYVIVGEKNADGKMVDYDDTKFREVNAGQLERSGGGRIPPSTSQQPEYYVPPSGDSSVIYRYDPETKKDVIVGYRTNGERFYFQSRATMEAVNKLADAGHLQPPQRPPTSSGDSVPPKDQFDSGHPTMIGKATNDDGKTYVWRWDSTAGRYCAVAESSDGKSFEWYSEEQYQTHNRGEHAIVMKDTAITSPDADPSQGEFTDNSSDKALRIDDDLDGGKHGAGDPNWGEPVYVIDRDTGQKVMVGVKIKTKDDPDGTVHHFNSQEMARYNDVHQTSDGKTYYSAKDVNALPDEYKKNLKDVTPQESNDDGPPERSVPSGGGTNPKQA